MRQDAKVISSTFPNTPKSSVQSLRLAYMTAIYPRATDTFIQREVAALRAHGVFIQTFSVRQPAAKEIVGPEQQAERQSTIYLLPPSPIELLRSQFSLFFGSPRRYLKALWCALTVRGGGISPLLHSLIYFAEGGLIAWHMRRQNIAHLHAHFSTHEGTVAMLAAELGGRSFSMTIHGPAEFFDPIVSRMGEKVRRAKFIACISQFCRSQVMVFADQDDWQKLRIIHCGVDPSLFKPTDHHDQGSRLLFVGRLAAVKGLPMLLEAVAQLKKRRPDIILTVAGDGPDRQRLTTQAEDLGLSQNVNFLGYQSQQQVRELLGQTDVFVMASFAEGVPVVLMEAMAASVPVVATRVAGVAELVEEGVSGYLVPPSDAPSIANAVERLLGDGQLRAKMGAAGREKVEREFNIATESKKLFHVLNDTC